MHSEYSIKQSAAMLSFLFFTIVFFTGPVSAQMPPPGNALSFDNTDDYIDMGDTIENFAAVTFEAWIYHTAGVPAGEFDIIASKSFVNGFAINAAENLVFNVGDGAAWGAGDITSTGTIPLNQWTHVAATWDGTNVNLYINGTFDTTGVNSVTAGNNADPRTVGGRPGERYFAGMIDELRIWNVARTQSQIRTSMSETLTGGEANLLAYYDFDQSNPDAVLTDRAGANDGTLTNMDPATDWAASGAGVYDPPGNALDFDGVSDYVEIPNDASFNFDTNDDFTVSFWANIPSTVPADTSIIEKYNGTPYPFVIRIANGTIICAQWDGATGVSVQSTSRVDDDQWHHVAYTREAGNFYLYIDGAMEDTAPDTVAGSTTNALSLNIGRRNDGSLYFPGQLDEIRIWNIGRTQPQILADMHNTIDPAANPSLVAYYRFDETGGTTLPDLTANGNDGTLGGTPVWTQSEAMCPFPTTATNVTPTDFTANWEAVSGATDYRIDVDDDPLFGSPAVTNQAAGGAVTSAAVGATINPGTVYYYRVRAEVGGWTSPDSAPASFMYRPGNALSFSDSDDRVPVNIDLPAAWTIEAWILTPLPVTAAGPRTLFRATGSQTAVLVDVSGLLGVWSGGLVSSGFNMNSLADGWHHLAAVGSGGTTGFYIDGAPVGTSAFQSTTELDSMGNGGFNRNFGTIDEVRVWNDVRTPAEIQNNMHVTLTGNEADLAVYYRFDHASGTELTDLSGNGNDGTLTNMTGFEWTPSEAMCPFVTTATDVTQTGFTANWEAVSGATDYRIDVDDDPLFGSPAAADQSAGGAVTSAAVGATINPGTVYYYRVRAEVGGWTSPDSASASFMLRPGYALSFDGLDDYVELGSVDAADPLALAGSNFTIEAWIRPTLTGDNFQRIVDKSSGGQGAGGYAFMVHPDGEIRININSSANYHTSPGLVVADEWNHVAVTGDGFTYTFYVNGDPTSGTFVAGAYTAPPATTTNMRLGTWNHSDTREYNGQMDEVRIWNTARSQGDIQANMHTTIDPAVNPNLVAYYQFDESAGTTLPDLTANGHDGTLANGPGWILSEAMCPIVNPATNVTETGFTANWEAVSGATDYFIDVADNPGFAPMSVDNQGAGGAVTSLAVTTGINAGTVYYYRVRAAVGGWTSPDSASGEFMLAPGNALDFDGMDDYVIANATTGIPSGNNPYSWEAWVNWNGSTGGVQKIVSWGIDFNNNQSVQIGIDTAGNFVVNHWGAAGDWTTNYSPPTGEWIHLAGTYDSTNETLYVNGAFRDSRVLPVVLAIPANCELRVGDLVTGIGGPYNEYFFGLIDEVRVWNTVRAQGDIQANMHVTLDPAANPDLVAYYRFDETTGTVLPDLTGNGNGGTFAGAPVWTQSEAMCPIVLPATNISGTGFTANWEAVAGATDYRIDVDDDPLFGSPEVADASTGAATSYAAASSGTVSYYRVRAEVGGWTSPNSASAEVMIPPGYALDFDGADDYVNCGNGAVIDLTSQITVEAWIRADAWAANYWENVIVAKDGLPGDGYTLRAGANGTASFSVGNAGGWYDALSPQIMTAGTWHHVAGTYDGNVVRVYVDGVEAGSRAFAGSIGSTANPLWIGDTPAFSPRRFDGRIDEVRIWNTALTETQIRANMCNIVDPASANLAAYYRFDHTSGTVLADLTGNGNDGALNGAPGPTWLDSDAFNIWTGNADTDWNNAANWTDGVPTAASNVYIPAAANAPSVNFNAVAVNHLVIDAGGNLSSWISCPGSSSLDTCGGGNVTVNGNFFNQGTVGAEIIMGGVSSQTLSSTSALSYLTVRNPNTNLGADLQITGMLTLEDANVIPNGYTLSYGAGGMLRYTGTAPATITGVEFPALDGPTHLIVRNTGGIDLDMSRAIPGSFEISGVFNTNDFNLDVGGNWLGAGTFNAGIGTVTLTGTNQFIRGSNTFYNLTKIVGTASTLYFGCLTTQTITGTLTLQGAAGNLLSLREGHLDAFGCPPDWNIDPLGIVNVAYLDVMDSANINANTIDATNNCVNSGNNTNWNFAAPVAVDDAYTVNEDTTLSEALPGVLVNDTDGDGQPLTAVLDTTTANGSLALNPDGSFTYTPDTDWFGTDTFTYMANDGNADSNIATVTITVDPVNDQPDFTAADPPAADEDSGAQTVAGWVTAFDPGNTFESAQAVLEYTVSAVGNPGLFSVQPAVSAAGVLTYTPAPDMNGTSTFTLAVRDNGGTPNGGTDTSATQTFTITVASVNDPPGFTASDPPASLEDAGPQSIVGWVSGFDPGMPDESGQSVAEYIVSGIGDPSLFASPPFVSVSGALNYTAAPDVFGSTTFDVAVRDDGGTASGGSDTSATQTFAITITPVNDPPDFTAANPPAVPEDPGPQTFTGWAAFDPGNTHESAQGVLAYTVGNVGDPSMFAAQPAVDVNGTLTFTPTTHAYGITTIDVSVRDNGGTANGGSDTSIVKTFSLNIGEVNDPPEITEGDTVEVFMDEDSWPAPFALTLNATDIEGDTLAWSIATQPANGAASAEGTGNSTQVGYVPNLDHNGTDLFVVRVSDGELSDDITVNVNIAPVNDAPVLDPSGFMRLNSIIEDIPDDENTGTSVAAIIASAGEDRITDPDAGALEGIAVMAVNNADSGIWEYALEEAPGGGSAFSEFPWNISETGALLLNETALIRFVPNPDFNGFVDPGITFRAWDRTSGSNGETADTTLNGGAYAFSENIETAMIGVNTGIDPPVIEEGGEITVEMDENGVPTAFDLTLTAIDPDRDVLTWRVGQTPQNGTAQADGTGNSISVEYTPDSGFVGTDTFTVIVSDSVNEAEITVNVTVNESPYQVEFTASATSGAAPLEVEFTDLSSGAEAWLWDFGDGTESTDQNPVHTYTTPGTHTVSLVISGAWGQKEYEIADYITVAPGGTTISFSGSPLSGPPPLEVSFTHTTLDDIDTFSWDFGDGSQSTEAAPVHVYESSGVYTVTLDVTGPRGPGRATREAYIDVLRLRSIGGEVTAEGSGTPIVDCQVIAWIGDEAEALGYTGSDGTFSLTGILPADNYVIEIRPPEGSGYMPGFYNGRETRDEADRVSTLDGDASGMAVTLMPESRLGISGRVVDASGNGVPSADVSLVSDSAAFSATATTDADGAYLASKLKAADDYIVSTVTDTFEEYYYSTPTASVFFWDEAAKVSAADPPATGIDIILNPQQGAFVSGHVYSGDGAPIADILVNAFSDNGSSGTGTTDAGGGYEIWGLAEVAESDSGNNGYLVEIWTDGYPYQAFDKADDPSSATLVATGRNDIDFTLKSGASISGTVTNSDGDPVAGVEIDAWPLAGGEEGSAVTGSDGAYQIDNLSAVDGYVVGAFPTDYPIQYYNQKPDPDAADTIDLGTGDVSGIDFVLDKGAVISGTLTLDDGAPVPAGITVYVWSDATQTGGFVETDANGNFEIVGLDPDVTDYVISIADPEFQTAFFGSGGSAASYDNAGGVSAGDGFSLSLSPGYTLQGLVTADGVPISGVDVEVSGSGQTAYATSTSDASGGFNFEITGLGEGTYTVTLGSDTYGTQTVDVTVSGDTVMSEVRLSLGPGRSISGTVVGLSEGGQAWVHAWSRSNDLGKIVEIRGTGNPVPYVIGDLPLSNDYRVEIDSDDHAYQVYDNTDDWENAKLVDITEQDATGVDFELAAADGVISGTVTFPDSAADGETVKIVAFSESTGAQGQAEVSHAGDAEVPYAITGMVVAEDYTVSIESDVYPKRYYDGSETGAADEFDAESVATGFENADIALEAGASLSGTVSADEMEGVRVETWSESLGSGKGAGIGEAGAFVIDGIDPADDYVVFAGKPDNPPFYFHPDGSVLDRNLAGEVAAPSDETIGIEIETGKSIGGEVRSRTGKPLSGVWIDAKSASKKAGNGAFTGRDGTFEITGLPDARDYAVTAMPEFSMGYDSQTKKSVKAGTEDVDFLLKPRTGYDIRGTVRDIRGDHVPNAEVEIRSASLGIHAWFVDGRTGPTDLHVKNLYEFAAMPESDDYVITVRPPSDTPHAFYIERNISLHEDNVYDIVLSLGATIEGTVYERDGSDETPLSRVRVTAWSAEYGFLGEAKSGKDGAYVITNAPDASDYVIVAWKKGYFEQKKTDERPSSKTDFYLTPGGAVEGTVKDRLTGRPIPGAKVQITSQYMIGVDGFHGTGVVDEDGRYRIDGLKKQYVDPITGETVMVDDYMATVYADGYPPISKGGISPDSTVNFAPKAGEAGLSGTVSGLAAGAVTLDIFENGGGYVKGVEIENGAFDVVDLPEDGEYQLRFTAHLPEGDLVQWAGEGDIGFDDPDGEENPAEAKAYSPPAEIAFEFTDGQVGTTRSANAPGPVRRLRSVSHVDRDARSLRSGEDGLPAVSELFSPVVGTVSSEPNITVTWEPTDDRADEEYYYVFNTERDFAINRRSAPKEYPARVRRATSRNLVGNDIPYYCHVAAVSKRGRIGATTTLAFQIDTVPPSNVSVSTLPEAADGFTGLQLGAVGAYEMYISNIGFGQGGQWEKWTSNRDWKNPGTGAEEIYVQFRDRAKNTVNAMPFADETPGIIVTAAVGPNGRIVPPGETEVENGASLSFTVTPDAGYDVDAFLVDGAPVTNLVSSYPSYGYQLSDIRNDTAISVTFKEVWLTITATAGPNGKIEPSGELVIRKDSDQTFVITPDPGHTIGELLLNGIPATPTDGNKLKLINITEDFDVTVTFVGTR